jgi:hypothetical protein
LRRASANKRICCRNGTTPSRPSASRWKPIASVIRSVRSTGSGPTERRRLAASTCCSAEPTRDGLRSRVPPPSES